MGPMVAVVSAWSGPPRVLLAEVGRDPEWTSEGRDNEAHGNLPTAPSSLLVLSNSWEGKAKPNPQTIK